MNQLKAGQIRWDETNKYLYMIIEEDDEDVDMWKVLSLVCFNKAFVPMEYMVYHRDSMEWDEVFDEPS
jgi:hypothetical protein